MPALGDCDCSDASFLTDTRGLPRSLWPGLRGIAGAACAGPLQEAVGSQTGALASLRLPRARSGFSDLGLHAAARAAALLDSPADPLRPVRLAETDSPCALIREFAVESGV